MVSLGITLLRSSLEQIESEISLYRIHGNISNLWTFATSEINAIFNQLGRSIGLLTAAQRDGNDQIEQFIMRMNEISFAWGQVVRRLIGEINILASRKIWEQESFDGLENIIEQGLQAIGIYPRYTNQGLWVDIPLSSKGQPGRK